MGTTIWRPRADVRDRLWHECKYAPTRSPSSHTTPSTEHAVEDYTPTPSSHPTGEDITTPHLTSRQSHVDRHTGVIFIDLDLPDVGRGLHTRLHRLPSNVNANYNSMLPFVYIDKLLLGKAVNHDISSLDELNHASDSTRSISPMSYTIIIKPHYHVGVASSLSYVIRLTSS
jgi:hypothetical protein